MNRLVFFIPVIFICKWNVLCWDWDGSWARCIVYCTFVTAKTILDSVIQSIIFHLNNNKNKNQSFILFYRWKSSMIWNSIFREHEMKEFIIIFLKRFIQPVSLKRFPQCVLRICKWHLAKLLFFMDIMLETNMLQTYCSNIHPSETHQLENVTRVTEASRGVFFRKQF